MSKERILVCSSAWQTPVSLCIITSCHFIVVTDKIKSGCLVLIVYRVWMKPLLINTLVKSVNNPMKYDYHCPHFIDKQAEDYKG